MVPKVLQVHVVPNLVARDSVAASGGGVVILMPIVLPRIARASVLKPLVLQVHVAPKHLVLRDFVAVSGVGVVILMPIVLQRIARASVLIAPVPIPHPVPVLHLVPVLHRVHQGT